MNAHVPPMMAADKQSFRDAMSAVAAPVHVITTDGAAGRAGITATAFTALTDEPPMVLVCLNRQSYTASVVNANRKLAVNCLPSSALETAARFAGKDKLSMPERFDAEVAWKRMASGAPVLPEAIAVFDCDVESIAELGTHYLYTCRVLAASHVDGDALLYQNRGYKSTKAIG